MMETLPFGTPFALVSAIVALIVEFENLFGLWMVAALAAAVISGFKSAYQKRMTGSYTDKEVAYVNSTYALVLLTPVGLWSVLTQEAVISPIVIVAALVSGGFNVLAVLLRMRALSLDDLSVIAPLASLTPITLAIVEPAVLGIAFDPIVLVAAVVAVGGAAVIVSGGSSLTGLSGRATTLGPLLAIGATLAYTVTTLADKFAVDAVPPFQYALALHVMMAIGTWGVLHASGSSLSLDRGQLFNREFHVLGLLRGGSLALIFLALSMTHSAAQVAIILQLALIIEVVLGGVAMGEEDTLQRTVGVALIIAGVGVVV